MVMEVCCGQCNGRLLVDTPGVVVACPHCGVHLSVPLPDDDPTAVDPIGEQQTASSRLEPAAPRQQLGEDAIITDSDSSSSPIVSSQNPVAANPAQPLAAVPAPTSSIFGGSEDEESGVSQSSMASATGSPDGKLTDAPVINTAPSAGAITLAVPANISSPTATGPDFSWMDRPTPAPAHDPAPSTPPQSSTVDQTVAFLSESNVSPKFTEASPPTQSLVETDLKPSNSTDVPGTTFVSPFEATTAFAAVDPPNPVSGSTASAPEPFAIPSFSFGTPETQTTAPPFDPGAFPTLDPGVSKPGTVDAEMLSGPAALHSVNNRSDAMGEKQSKLTLALLIVGSYASLMTIYVIYLTLFGRKHQLESLPDLKTVQQSGGRAIVPRPENNLPAGHQLKLGQAERFGNIRVTPLRVTRGPITFAHYSGGSTSNRAPSEPVLKLWLKFENLSDRQTIVPLDTTLMFFQRPIDDRVASYNVLFRESDRKDRNAHFYYLFDRMAVDSEWTLVGQHTNEELAPGQSFETFVPSEENTEGLTGNVVWRVHFRKGYGPETGNGVTTLIDVLFNSDDVKPDPA